jgi:hypothetical protein
VATLRSIFSGLCAVVGLAVLAAANPAAAQSALPSPAPGGAPSRAAAQAPVNVFTVAAVPVDATAASAIAAREAARLDGQRRAFTILLNRLTLASDHGRLPRIPDAKLTEIVRDFEVANERSSAVRYLADYTFRFRPEEVRQILRNAGIPFAETVSKPVTVVPVLRQGGSAVLWDDPNPWREAWADRKEQGGLVPLVLPQGEAADVSAIGADQAIANDPDALNAIAARYGGGDVLVAQATLSDAGQLDTSIRRVSGSTVTPVSTAAYRANPGESQADFMGRAVTASIADLEDAWKRQTVLGFGSEAVLTADVPIGDLADWLYVRDHLMGVPAITRSDLLALGKSGARLEIHYSGDPSKLQLALAQRDLTLSGSGASWILQRRGAAPAATPPLAATPAPTQ